MPEPAAPIMVVREALDAGGLSFVEFEDFVNEVRAHIAQGFEPGPVVARVRFRSGLDRLEMTFAPGTGAR